MSFNPEPTPVNKQEIKSAEQMILEEITNIKNELKHGELDREYLEKTWEETLKNIHFDNQAKKFYFFYFLIFLQIFLDFWIFQQ